MLKKILSFGAALFMSAQAMAAHDVNVIYLEVDRGEHLLERQDPAFRHVFDHTGNFLKHDNIKLFEQSNDETRRGRSLEEAQDMAKAKMPRKIDAIVAVSVEHQQRGNEGRLKDRLVATAAIIDPQSARVIDRIEVNSPTARIREGRCDYECRDMIMRRHVQEILPKFRERLADRLHGVATRTVVSKSDFEPSQWQLTLKGFKTREARHIENRIARLESTRDLSSLHSSEEKPVFWLERRESSPNVRSELSGVLASLDLKARIIQTNSSITLIKLHSDLAYLD